jgi:hypothetical protein
MYCTQPWTTVYVTWNGKVRTCCFNEYLLGDLNQTAFHNVWNGYPYKNLRKQVINGGVLKECTDCLAGKSTPDYVDSFWNLLGLSS